MKYDLEIVKKILNYSVDHYIDRPLLIKQSDDGKVPEFDVDFPTLQYHLKLLENNNIMVKSDVCYYYDFSPNSDSMEDQGFTLLIDPLTIGSLTIKGHQVHQYLNRGFFYKMKITLWYFLVIILARINIGLSPTLKEVFDFLSQLKN